MELDDALMNKSLSTSTKLNYNYAYKKLMVMTNGVNIHTIKNNKLVDLLKELDIPPMSKNGMISVCILILKHYNKPITSLIKYRELIKDEHFEKNQNDSITSDKLVSIKELNDYNKQLYLDKKYVDFIINYLLVNYGLRNLDLDLTIVNNKSQVNNKYNFIYLTTKYVVVIINIYKTASTYGKKKFTIYNNDLIRAVKELISDKKEINLINVVDKDSFIKSRTLNNLGETLIFKSIISELARNNNQKEIRRLASTRGTDIGTIYKFYQIEN